MPCRTCWRQKSPPAAGFPRRPAPAARTGCARWPTSRIATAVIGTAKTGIATAIKRFSALRSNSGDSSSTAIASMTSSTSGRYRSVRLTDTRVSNDPSTTPASSSDWSGLQRRGSGPGERPRSLGGKVEAGQHIRRRVIQYIGQHRDGLVDVGFDRRRRRQHQIGHPLAGKDRHPGDGGSGGRSSAQRSYRQQQQERSTTSSPLEIVGQCCGQLENPDA